MTYAKSEMLKHNETEGYLIYPMVMPVEYRGEDHANMIRKMQSSFSWDWGPSCPSSGIWLVSVCIIIIICKY